MFKTLTTLFVGGVAGWHLARSRNADDVAAVFSDKDIYKIGYEQGSKTARISFLTSLISGISEGWRGVGIERESDEEILGIISDQLQQKED